MTDNAQYPAGVYVKGDDARIARTPATAVALAFSGYALAKSDAKTEPENVAAPVTEGVDLDGPDRKELQRLAKEAGIPANLSNDEITAALEAHTNPSNQS